MRKDANPKIYCACSGNTSFFHYRCIKHLLRDTPLESKWYFCSKTKSAIYLICFNFHFLIFSTRTLKNGRKLFSCRESSLSACRGLCYLAPHLLSDCSRWWLKEAGGHRLGVEQTDGQRMKEDAHRPGGISGKKSGRHNNPWCAQKSVSDGGKHCIQSIRWKCTKPNSMKIEDI